jgi:hypothetical protein
MGVYCLLACLLARLLDILERFICMSGFWARRAWADGLLCVLLLYLCLSVLCGRGDTCLKRGEDDGEGGFRGGRIYDSDVGDRRQGVSLWLVACLPDMACSARMKCKC